MHLEAGLPLSMVLTECSMLYGKFEVPMCQVSVPLFLCHVLLETCLLQVHLDAVLKEFIIFNREK